MEEALQPFIDALGEPFFQEDGILLYLVILAVGRAKTYYLNQP